MYWHRTHKTSLRVKKTIPESMPCTMGAWYCGWGDHNLPQDTSCDIFILYCHLIFAFHRKTHLRCISSVLLHYNCKINTNIQDVYHRPNLERAQKVGSRLFSYGLFLLNFSRKWSVIFNYRYVFHNYGWFSNGRTILFC